ncbi:hypothetical protein DyAD56_08225 [Dyella sp. AD56]|uniref:hypothetical protein n=1 Tax=Dyella sp. AD56 TaxID=1528744 RepID=UPI000CADED00|nr:hypothetical protein [Dyella sp. AD56]PMQ05768.1 hypothetical protein DyAD56_08225 [Dyella sp. AD56]
MAAWITESSHPGSIEIALNSLFLFSITSNRREPIFVSQRATPTKFPMTRSSQMTSQKGGFSASLKLSKQADVVHVDNVVHTSPSQNPAT